MTFNYSAVVFCCFKTNFFNEVNMLSKFFRSFTLKLSFMFPVTGNYSVSSFALSNRVFILKLTCFQSFSGDWQLISCFFCCFETNLYTEFNMLSKFFRRLSLTNFFFLRFGKNFKTAVIMLAKIFRRLAMSSNQL